MRTRAVLFTTTALALGACTLSRSGTAPEPGAGGAGAGNPTGGSGAVGTGGTGGELPACTVPGDCGPDTDCETPTCTNQTCGVDLATLGTACDDQGGEVCDGAGACLLDLGSGCANAAECAEGFCVEQRCCENACGGVCRSCAVVGSEGSCAFVPPADNPSAECGAGVCDGAGSCAEGTALFSRAWGDPGVDDDQGWAVAFDSQGNVIVAGTFQGTIDLGGAPQTSVGTDLFVIKLDPLGGLLWWRAYASVAGDQGVDGMAIGTGDAIYLAGDFTGSLALGGALPALPSAGGSDVYVAKLDASGNPLWAKAFGDASDQNARALARDANDNVYVSGWATGQITFVAGVPLTAVARDAFVASLQPDGDPRYGRLVGGTGNASGYGLAVDATGRALVVGPFDGSIDLGPGGLATADGTDAFAVVLDAAGALAAGARYGGPGEQTAFGASAASDGFVVVGRYDTGIDFGVGGAPGLVPVAAGSDGFVAKLDAALGEVWSRDIGSPVYDDLYTVDVDVNGNVLVAGEAEGSVDFAGVTMPTIGGLGDVLLCKLSADGTPLWGKLVGGPLGQEWAYSVATSLQGRVAVVGPFNGAIDLGSGSLAVGGGYDAFLGVYGP
ncbi:MAG: hypothetical protein HY908_31890 [Myxococcales bacterium]|nr:hypothetical protein [Myxococcales bacterium]